MTSPTREQIAALLELEAKATPGPYHINRGSIYTDDDGLIGSPLFKHVGRDPDRRWGSQSSFRQVEDDLAFIAAARNRIRPLAEAYQRQPDVIKAAQLEVLKGMREPLIDVLTHLVAAHSLLSRSPKKAAPSDKMFDQMLADYERSIERGREAITELDRRILALEQQP